MACISREREFVCDDLEEVLSVTMTTEDIYCIDRAIMLLPKTIRDQVLSGHSEVKFCTRDNWDKLGDQNTEYYELVFFPMYTHLGEEIPHGTIVSHEDSPVNGNLTIENGKIVEATSNHCLYEYEDVADPTLEFAEKVLQGMIDQLVA